jgi:putative endonuclease
LKPEWWVYLVRCCDGSLYCGIAKDVQQRVKRHNAGRGARYTRAHRPVVLVWCESADSHGAALRRERQIKGMRRKQKEALIGRG